MRFLVLGAGVLSWAAAGYTATEQANDASPTGSRQLTAEVATPALPPAEVATRAPRVLAEEAPVEPVSPPATDEAPAQAGPNQTRIPFAPGYVTFEDEGLAHEVLAAGARHAESPECLYTLRAESAPGEGARAPFLSNRRLESVRAQLAEAGVPPRRLRIEESNAVGEEFASVSIIRTGVCP
ncbi:MAG: hypothetical protein ACI9KE_002579 [Polyangiales bacterium]|jgi:hypothetical protein